MTAARQIALKRVSMIYSELTNADDVFQSDIWKYAKREAEKTFLEEKKMFPTDNEEEKLYEDILKEVWSLNP